MEKLRKVLSGNDQTEEERGIMTEVRNLRIEDHDLPEDYVVDRFKGCSCKYYFLKFVAMIFLIIWASSVA